VGAPYSSRGRLPGSAGFHSQLTAGYTLQEALQHMQARIRKELRSESGLRSWRVIIVDWGKLQTIQV